MNKLIVLISTMALFGISCVTQQLHFMSVTNDQNIQELKSISKSFTIKGITGTDECSHCSEWSKIVWHGANYPFEGFFPIIINDWTSFINETLKSNDENREIEIDIL
jgi:hypothetical protein